MVKKKKLKEVKIEEDRMDLKATVGDLHPTEQDDTYLLEFAAFLTKDQYYEIMNLKQNGKIDIFVKGTE